MLDTFTLFPGKQQLEQAVTAALKLLHTALRLSEEFNARRTAGASTVLTGLYKLLLGVNPRTGRPDHMLNMTRFVFYGYWLPQARLAAVNIIKFVSDSTSHHPDPKWTVRQVSSYWSTTLCSDWLMLQVCSEDDIVSIQGD